MYVYYIRGGGEKRTWGSCSRMFSLYFPICSAYLCSLMFSSVYCDGKTCLLSRSVSERVFWLVFPKCDYLLPFCRRISIVVVVFVVVIVVIVVVLVVLGVFFFFFFFLSLCAPFLFVASMRKCTYLHLYKLYYYY